MDTPLISIVSPVYMAEAIIDTLVQEIINSVSLINENFEIILVEDGSPDNSWDKIEEQCRKDERIKGIKLSRNFGQHYAITAGLEHVNGEWIVVMDCDLQDRPQEIVRLYEKALEGFDIVFARRINREDDFLKKFFSINFYLVLGYLTGTSQDSTIANFGIYHKKAISAVCSMGDGLRNFNTMIKWVGFKMAAIDVQHGKREIGKTTYSFSKSMILAIDTMISFSDKPLRLTIQLGLLISFFSFVIGVIYLIRYIGGEITVLGFTSLIISVWFLSGIIIFILGVIGLYIGKTFEKVKNRPLYIIDNKINFN